MGVNKESISKFLIGNRFYVKLRILKTQLLILRTISFTQTKQCGVSVSPETKITFLFKYPVYAINNCTMCFASEWVLNFWFKILEAFAKTRLWCLTE